MILSCYIHLKGNIDGLGNVKMIVWQVCAHSSTNSSDKTSVSERK